MDEPKRIILTSHDRAALAMARRILAERAEPLELATILCLDSMAEQYDSAPESGETDYPNCDDPGAHRPGCRCNGGEPLL